MPLPFICIFHVPKTTKGPKKPPEEQAKARSDVIDLRLKELKEEVKVFEIRTTLRRPVGEFVSSSHDLRPLLVQTRLTC